MMSNLTHTHYEHPSSTKTSKKEIYNYIVRLLPDLDNFSYHNQASLIITNYYFTFFFPVGGTPYPDWNEWKVVYEIKVNKHRMSQPEHISDEL